MITQNLYTRLKPQNKVKLDVLNDSIPFYIGNLIKSLTSNQNILELQYGRILDLHSYLLPASASYNDVYRLFDDFKKGYPFNEGDDYYTIEDGEIIESCWDYVSEDLHDMNPSKKYYTNYESATEALNN